MSFDTFIVWRQWWLSPENERWQPVSEGLHIDQNPFYKPGMHCVQGMIPLEDVTLETGGLEVVPGSNSRKAQKYLRKHYTNY